VAKTKSSKLLAVPVKDSQKASMTPTLAPEQKASVSQVTFSDAEQVRWPVSSMGQNPRYRPDTLKAIRAIKTLPTGPRIGEFSFQKEFGDLTEDNVYMVPDFVAAHLREKKVVLLGR